MSEITKRAFASSLKKMLAKKPLEKIRIIDITEYCGVNRQTFYYHFKDIYDLLEWVYTNEATKALGEKKTYETWQQGFKQIFQYIVNNKEFVLTTFNSVSREYLERYLYNEVYLLLIGVVEEKAKGIPVREKDKSFIADFYKYAFVGMAIDWIDQGMNHDYESLIFNLSTLIEGDFHKALLRFEGKY